MHEVGSFDWYKNYDDKFFYYLTKAIMYADNSNIKKLGKIFPHIFLAFKEYSWNKAPEIDYPLTINIPTLFPEEKLNDFISNNSGTFFEYLKESGDFLKNFSHAVAYADKHNKKLISFQYPQIISAFYMPLWNMCPSGFEFNGYNSPQKT